MSLWDWDDPADRAAVSNGPFTLRVLEALPPHAYHELHPPLRVEICRMCGLAKTLEEAKAEARVARSAEALAHTRTPADASDNAPEGEAPSGSSCTIQ